MTSKLDAGKQIGDFTIISYIGRGSYGDVYYVSDPLGKRFALKLLHEEFTDASEREIQGISLLRKQIHSSEYLPIIYYVGKFANRIYYTMDAADNYNFLPHIHTHISTATPSADANDSLHGKFDEYCPDTLEQHLKNGRHFTLEEILEMFLEILASTNALHQHDIVHRDIKPANIIRFNGKWMLTDFGLLSNTPKTFIGSPGFLAPFPEGGLTLQSEKEGDLYALGKVLYCLFSGEPVNRYPLLPEKYAVEDAAIISQLYHKACAISPKPHFHSCDEFIDAVTATKTRLFNHSYRKKRWLLASSVAVLLLVAAILLHSLPQEDVVTDSNAPQTPASVAVATPTTPDDAVTLQATAPTTSTATREYQDGFVKIYNRDQEYQILCCFPGDKTEAGMNAHSRENQFKAMGMVKASLTYFLGAQNNEFIKIRHAVYLKEPSEEGMLMVYMYAIQHEDCWLTKKKLNKD